MFKLSIANPILREIVDWAIVIGLALVLAFVARTFLFRVTRVSGDSMLPSFNNGDVLILNRLAYRIGSPAVGDIVAFPYPQDPSSFFIKRIIAGPGDVVDLQGYQFWVNGAPLDDAFSHEPVTAFASVTFPLTVEEGRFFVLGDNRNHSRDSRYLGVGNIYGSDLLGRASIRVWPFNALGRVN